MLPQLDGVTDVDRLVEFAFSHTITPSQIRSELIELAKVIAEAEPVRALEIGTCGGGTLFLLCRLAAPVATVVSVDLPRGPYGAGYSALRIPLYKRFAGPRQSLHLVRADSHHGDTVDRVNKAFCGKPLDFVFIDGDHSYKGVKRDFEIYSPLVKKGGIVGFHDIAPHPAGWSGDVPRFWDEIKGRYSWREIVAVPNGGYGIGILFT
jgi:predicted O-methyltransferase YrrM